MSELMHVSQISILSDRDRDTINECRRWARFIWQQGTAPKMDVLTHEGIYELMCRLDDLYTRTMPEPQLAGRHTLSPMEVHSLERESVCTACGGRAINGCCISTCERLESRHG